MLHPLNGACLCDQTSFKAWLLLVFFLPGSDVIQGLVVVLVSTLEKFGPSLAALEETA